MLFSIFSVLTGLQSCWRGCRVDFTSPCDFAANKLNSSLSWRLPFMSTRCLHLTLILNHPVLAKDEGSGLRVLSFSLPRLGAQMIHRNDSYFFIVLVVMYKTSLILLLILVIRSVTPKTDLIIISYLRQTPPTTVTNSARRNSVKVRLLPNM